MNGGDLAGRAIELLSGERFMVTLSRVEVGGGRQEFVMHWRKKGSRWWTQDADLQTVGRNACSWFDVRRTGEGDEESFANRGEVSGG